jgi:hypothetical protein
MTILNISLCLPELDIVALAQKHTIVAVTERFIVPDKSFVLLPCRQLLDSVKAELPYQPQVFNALKASSNQPGMAMYWAQCMFCQQVVDESAIELISDRTIWTQAALLSHLKTRGKLFLSFLQVYELLEAVPVDIEPVCDQLYRFLPLPRHLEVTPQGAVLSDAEFGAAKQALLEPANLSSGSFGTNNTEEEISSPPAANVLNSPDWVSKISEIGNSSEGHTFEKLVRKALLELGFSNSQNQPATSLDPNATGGAGGLDFYADYPYPIVGECKATSTDKINSNATSQLIVLGMKHLLDDYQHCVKLVVAAGKITHDAHQIAEAHGINVIRPETLQALVELKLKYENSVDLDDLKIYLKNPPFSIAANDHLLAFMQELKDDLKHTEQGFQQGVQIIQTIKDLSAQTIHKGQKAFVIVEIRAHYNAKYQPLMTDEATKDILIELSSPFSGFLARKHLPGDQERFYWVKDMQE